jgi:hypothetical protein
LKYVKPELNIVKFSIIDEIAAGGTSSGGNLPQNPDDSNDPGYEIIDKTNQFNLGQ